MRQQAALGFFRQRHLGLDFLPFFETLDHIQFFQNRPALEAAHGENYIHRDLKPQNIMVSEGGKVTVMDFGLARSVEMGGMTQSNTLLGTPTYMSPEQAKGLTLDARSDLFALGNILYEMLTGQIPFQADTILATLLKRTQEPPLPPTQLNPEISPGLNDIVMKCLTLAPEQRYQTATELLYTLETQSGVPSDSPMSFAVPMPVSASPSVAAPAARGRRQWVAAGLGVLLVVVISGLVFRNKLFVNAEQPKPVTVLVADLENNTGDPVFDNTLESLFIIAMEGASFVNAYNRGQARQISEQAIETLQKLVALYPADSAGHNNLSIAYAYVRNLPEALQASRHALEVNPVNVQAHLNFAVYSMLAGDFNASISESERILKQNPNYEFAYLPLALSTLAKGDVKGAGEIYTRLAEAGPNGYSLAKFGEADLDMYLGRYKEALQALQAGIAADQKENNTGELAVKYVASAEAYLALGQRAQAIEAANKAVQLSPVESIVYLAARILLQSGDPAGARALAERLDAMLQPQTKSYARLIAGEIALERHDTTAAVEAFMEGNKLLDSWISHFLLGRAYLEANHYAEAWAQFDLCWKRSGEAADLFFADMTTMRYLPPLYYWSGRAQEGLQMKEAAQNNYQVFLKLRADADPAVPLVADAKQRIAAAP